MQKVVHEDDDQRVEFLIKKGHGLADEIETCNNILDFMEKDLKESQED